MPGSTGALLCLLFTLTGSGGAESCPPLRFLYAYFARLIITNMQPKTGRGGQLVMITKRLGAIESNNPGRCQGTVEPRQP